MFKTPVTGEGKDVDTCYCLGSGGWVSWANDTTVLYASNQINQPSSRSPCYRYACYYSVSVPLKARHWVGLSTVG